MSIIVDTEQAAYVLMRNAAMAAVNSQVHAVGLLLTVARTVRLVVD